VTPGNALTRTRHVHFYATEVTSGFGLRRTFTTQIWASKACRFVDGDKCPANEID
jgi:hypothetical protein